jgi:hypothetical protein
MTTPDQPASILTPRKVAVQVVGFVLGLGLLAWCIVIAVRGGDWSLLASAHPGLIAGLIACSVVSFGINGTVFWLTIRPVQPVRMFDQQLLNMVSNVLNYAPIRAGLVARIAFNLRIERLSIIQVGAWYAAIGVTIALPLGACVAATVVRPAFDAWWMVIVLAQIGLGGLLISALLGQPVFVRYGRGMEQMLRQPACLWGAIALRLIDIGAYVGRMACAVAIMDIDLAAPDILLMAFATLAVSMNPIGRVGFREAAVAFVAARLTATSLTDAEVAGRFFQLALIESAGEALVAVPLGALALLWYWRRMGSR